MLTVEQAQEVVLQSVTPLSAERVPLLRALGRVLAEPVVARVPLPTFDNSAMDGFAVRAEDTEGASPDTPRRLEVIEDIPAGSTPQKTVRAGTAARIMTGAPIPAGADAVVIVENTHSADSGTVEIFQPALEGANIRRAGQDVATGGVALSPPQLLGPGELGVISALGVTEVSAVRRPKVGILTTGCELTEPGEELKPGTVYNSNRVAVQAGVLRAGGELGRCAHAPDEEAELEKQLRSFGDEDLLLTTGGVSVGEYDLVKKVLARVGDIEFWRVRMKPGKPVVFGTVLGRTFFGLPGNPISSLVTFELFVAPAIRKLAGRDDVLPLTVEAELARDAGHRPGRPEYRQAVTSYAGGYYMVEPTAKRGSGMLTSAVGANSLLVMPDEYPELHAGDRVKVILLGRARQAV